MRFLFSAFLHRLTQIQNHIILTQIEYNKYHDKFEVTFNSNIFQTHQWLRFGCSNNGHSSQSFFHIYTHKIENNIKIFWEKSVKPKAITFLNKGNWFLYTMRTEYRFIKQLHLKKMAREETLSTRLYLIYFQLFVGYLIYRCIRVTFLCEHYQYLQTFSKFLHR